MSAETQKPIVMVVDDAPLNLQILSEILKDDYDVVFATNGPDALLMAEMNHPDLILLDIQMPDMDGYEVIRVLKSTPHLENIPVIFLTAMSQKEDEELGLQLGAVDYITKPIKPALVKLRIKNHLLLKAQRDTLLRQKEELENTIKRIKQLEGIIPICMYCKKIRNEQDMWQQIEVYISEHSEAFFSHGICEECFKKEIKTL